MQPKKPIDNSDLLRTISERAELEEGEEGVRRILREIFRNKKVSTRQLAQSSRLPTPVVAAVRRELEKVGMLARDGGASLTEKGQAFVKEQLGLVYTQKLTCPACKGRSIETPNNFTQLLEMLKKHLNTRPKPLPWLDQAHATPETALQRALYMLEKGDVEGRRIIFLGDDDFTSIAVAMLRAAREITVIDMDARLLEAIQLISQKESLQVNCVEHDLTEPLPEHLHHRYDVAFTDPPYTVAGLTLFVSRGIAALQRREGASIYLAFAHQPPRKMLAMQKTLGNMGLSIAEQIPRFNVYEGAEMFANTTFLARLETTEKTKPLVTGTYKGKLYTGEITQTVRTYQCHCDEQINVGATESLRTVEELKERGCPKCGRTLGFKLVSKRKLKEALAERMVLRSFEWTEFPTILEFEREIARKSFPEAPILDEEYHRQKLERVVEREPDSLKVALLNGEIVGWLWLRTEKDRSTNEKFGYVKSIIVKPEHRHQGFGGRLMEAAKDYFLQRGIRRIDLIVSTANHEAAAFFEEAGFEREHSTMRKRLNREG